MRHFFKRFYRKSFKLLATFIITVILVNIISCEKAPPPSDTQFIRVYNLSETNFDTITIKTSSTTGYDTHMHQTNVEPQSFTSFVKFDHLRRSLHFILTKNDSVKPKHYLDWYFPSTLVDPMNHADKTFPSGYYTFLVSENQGDTTGQKYLVSLWNYSINDPDYQINH